MYEIVKDMVFKDLVMYIDDIIIFSDTYDEKYSHLTEGSTTTPRGKVLVEG